MSQENKHNLPSLLGEIAGVADLQTALVIARDWGGMQVYFPSPYKIKKDRLQNNDHALTKLVGYEFALKISEHFAVGKRGASFQIPHGLFGSRAQNHREIDNMVKSGLSHSQIAHKLKIDISTITRRKQKTRSQIIPKTPFDVFFDEK